MVEYRVEIDHGRSTMQMTIGMWVVVLLMVGFLLFFLKMQQKYVWQKQVLDQIDGKAPILERRLESYDVSRRFALVALVGLIITFLLIAFKV